MRHVSCGMHREVEIMVTFNHAQQLCIEDKVAFDNLEDSHVDSCELI